MMQEQDQGQIEQLPEQQSDVRDTPDGGAVVSLDEALQSAPDRSFYDNLAGDLVDASGLAKIDSVLRPLIESDKRVRAKRDEDYADAIKRTGLGGEDGAAAFTGGSTAIHPVLSKAAVDFEARAILELFPSGGPAKPATISTPTQARVDKADRLAKHMNWQCRFQMPEFRAELEQALSQVSLAGSQFMYGTWDEQLKRPRFTYWPADHLYLPYAASSLRAAERVTMVELITQRTFEQRVGAGLYSEDSMSKPALVPEMSEAEQAAAKVEGKEADSYNEDGLRPIWRCFTYLDLEEDTEADGPAPYVIEMDANSSGHVLRVARNWKKGDPTKEPLQWLVELPFLPWRGALSIGLGQAVGKLAGAGSGALRALLDAALVNTFPGMAKLKGANVVGQAQNVSIGTMVELEGGMPGEEQDIRKLLMPLPYNQPSPVLQQLMGTIVQECEGFVQTSMRNITEDNVNQMPVGTVLSVLEEGLRTLNAVHARLHVSMYEMLRLLFRLNALYLDEQELKDETGEVLAHRRDYEGPVDVEPVSDPNVFSESQRYAQMQLVAQRAQLLPQLYDMRAVEVMILKRTRIPDYEKLLLPPQTAQPNNAVNENMMMSLGRPTAAFPEQDHLAHIQVHVDFLNSPMLGQNPLLAPKFIGAVLQHLAEHMVMWYVSESLRHADEAVSRSGQAERLTELMDPKSHEVSAEVDRLLAMSSTDVVQGAQSVFAKLPPIIQQAQLLLKQYQPQMPQDPKLAAAQMQAQTKLQSDQSRERIADKQLQAKTQSDAQKQAADARTKLQLVTMQEQGDTQREREQMMVRERMNTADNTTAMQIAAAEIAAGNDSNLSTGTGINPGGGT